MVDDGRLSPAVCAAILRVLRVSNPQPGAMQGGDAMGGDGPADDWNPGYDGSSPSRGRMTEGRVDDYDPSRPTFGSAAPAKRWTKKGLRR